MNGLTARQAELLEQIARSWRDGRAPQTSELITAMRVARESSLTDLLRPLERKGFITVEGGVRGRQRHIALTARGRTAAGLGLPVLGCIPAGPLREAFEDAQEWIDTAHALLPFQPGDFLLCVEGDSMIGDGILSGDKVLLRPQVQVQNGEIAAVQIQGEATELVAADGTYCATLKHVHFSPEESLVRLRASNSQYEDLLVPAEAVSIAGVYRGLVRTHHH
jgi:repressor LexA